MATTFYLLRIFGTQPLIIKTTKLRYAKYFTFVHFLRDGWRNYWITKGISTYLPHSKYCGKKNLFCSLRKSMLWIILKYLINPPSCSLAICWRSCFPSVTQTLEMRSNKTMIFFHAANYGKIIKNIYRRSDDYIMYKTTNQFSSLFE